jgi:immune inhibitor A
VSTKPRIRARDNATASPPPQHRPGFVGAALCLLLALLLGAGCGGSSHPAKNTPASTLVAPGSDEPARRDLVDLASRLRGVAAPARAVQLPPLKVGDVQPFDLVDLPADPNKPPGEHSISATVRAVSDHAYFAFQNGAAEVDDAELQAAVRAFEDTIWPKVTGAFGLPAIPGVDGDPRIVILGADLGPNIGGYVNGDDAYPRELVRHSNQREMVYINLSWRPLGSEDYDHALAHELQHLIHQAHGGDGATWINEGLSEVSGGLVSAPMFYTSFLDHPDTQLTTWGDGSDDAHYGASALFFDYLLGQTGGDAARLASEPGYDTDGVRAFLRDVASPRTFEQMVADWAVANVLDEPQGPYGYAGRDVSAAAATAVSSTGAGEGDVHQFAADYLALDANSFAGPVGFTFEGDTQVPVLAGQPSANGAFLWSGRGDNLDSTLTRELDLTDVKKATLTFRTWFDTERWFDFGYVEASSDGGKTWHTLAGQQTSTNDPLGVTYGPGYTGQSGGGQQPAWVDERIDLSPYAGKRALLRFELINDDGTNGPGWAIDGIAVPEIGFSDDAEHDAGGWQRQGFRRVSQELPQRFAVRLITMGATPQVQEIALDAQNRAKIDLSGLGTDYRKAVIVVLGETDGTTERASYRYNVAPGGGP